MKEKGIGTGAIIGIVVTVVVVAVVVPLIIIFALGIGGGAPGGLPEYPGATSYELPPEVQGLLPQGIQLKAYSTSASVSDVINWYKEQMPGQGWTYDSTHSEESYGLLIYQRGNDGAMILVEDWSYGASDITLIVLAAGSYDTILSGE